MVWHGSLFEACMERCMILQVMARPGQVTRLQREPYWPQLAYLAKAETSEGLMIFNVCLQVTIGSQDSFLGFGSPHGRFKKLSTPILFPR